MNPEIKELWIAALESGEYKQGRGRLRTLDDKFCCLGVLCDLAVKAEITEWLAVKAEITEWEEGEGYWGVDGNSGSLPKSVREWSGVDVNDGETPNGSSLICLNDEDILTFPEIAQVIREEF